MKEQLQELKSVKETLQAQKDQYLKEHETFNEQHKDLIDGIERNKNKIFGLTEEIKTEALKEYEKTGNKKLFGGVGIRIMTTLEYDKDIAFMWAKQHEMALLLDTRTFEKLAKVQNLDFVKSSEIPTTTIPAKLE